MSKGPWKKGRLPPKPTAPAAKEGWKTVAAPKNATTIQLLIARRDSIGLQLDQGAAAGIPSTALASLNTAYLKIAAKISEMSGESETSTRAIFKSRAWGRVEAVLKEMFEEFPAVAKWWAKRAKELEDTDDEG